MMKDSTRRGLENAIKLTMQAPEFDRLRLFLVADSSEEKPEAEEIIKTICDAFRAHLVDIAKATRGMAAAKRSI